MGKSGLTVFIVDDDPSVRDSIALMLGLVGYRTAVFADAESFETAWQPDWRGCAVADLKLPGRSGIELLERFRARGISLPFVMISAHGDVPSARAAFLHQAVDFLEKPFTEAALRAAIDLAFAREGQRTSEDESRIADQNKLAKLTPRELEVLNWAASGRHAKEIAAELGISPRTVEVHRSRIMEKLGVRNVAELVRFAVAAGVVDPRAQER